MPIFTKHHYTFLAHWAGENLDPLLFCRTLALAMLLLCETANAQVIGGPTPMVPDASNSGPYAAQNLGVNKAQFEHWRAALARVAQGSGRGRLLVLSDSTSVGAGAGSGGTTDMNGAWPYAWPATLASLFRAGGVPASDNGFFGNVNSPVTFATYDTRVTLGTGWKFNVSVPSVGGSTLEFTTGSASTFALTPGASFGNSATVGQFDTFIVYYIQQPSAGTFTVNVDGGSSLGTINCAGSQAVVGHSFTVTKGTHTINVVASNDANFYIIGVLPYDSTVPAIDIVRGGIWGGLVANFIGTSAAWSPQNAFKNAVAPDLTIIALTVNDSNNGTALATYATNLASLTATGLATGDVVLATGPPSNTAAATNGTLAQYMAVEQALSVADNLPFVSIVGRWGSYAAINAIFPYFDTLHPEALGYWDIGRAYEKALVQP